MCEARVMVRSNQRLVWTTMGGSIEPWVCSTAPTQIRKLHIFLELDPGNQPDLQKFVNQRFSWAPQRTSYYFYIRFYCLSLKTDIFRYGGPLNSSINVVNNKRERNIFKSMNIYLGTPLSSQIPNCYHSDLLEDQSRVTTMTKGNKTRK